MPDSHRTSHPSIGLGIIGAGGFARFVRDAIATMRQFHITAIVDQDSQRATALASLDDATVHADVASLLDDPAVEAILVATPPSTHAELTCQALSAGRHVLCEKPAALDPDDMRRIAELITRCAKTYAVDHVIHHNPLVQLLHRLRAAGVLGPLQRFSFDNDAGDSDLDPDHWFWKPELSGGILLEHGVHFFDVARLLANSPEEQAQTMTHRRADGRLDTVVTTVRHANGALATHSHGFSHANPTERQLMRLDFGLAEARLEGWIPLELRLDAWLDDAGLAILEEVGTGSSWLATPGFEAGPNQQVELTRLDGAAQPLRTHDMDHHRPHHVLLTARLGLPSDKQEVYRQSVRAVLTDFATCIAEPGRTPGSGLREGAASVMVAHAATLAQDGSPRVVEQLQQLPPAD